MTIRRSFAVTVSLLALASACSKQGEGDRCISSSDCDDGLTCQPPTNTTTTRCDPSSPSAGKWESWDCQPALCCPSGQQSSVELCNIYQFGNPVSGNTGTGNNSGTGGSGSTGPDAGGDAGEAPDYGGTP